MYPLGSRPPLRTYVNGRTIVLGDAAHPMLPLHAGAGTTALEDAAALEIAMSDLPPGAHSLHLRLKLWDAVRRPRNATIQLLSNTAFDRPEFKLACILEEIRRHYIGPLPDAVPTGWAKVNHDFFCTYDAYAAARCALEITRCFDQKQWNDEAFLRAGLQSVIPHFGVVA